MAVTFSETEVGGTLTAAEATIIAASMSERMMEFGFVTNGDAANTRVATLRIKDASAVIVAELVAVLDKKAFDSNNKHAAYLWDSAARRKLPAGWTVTALADAASVVRWNIGISTRTVT